MTKHTPGPWYIRRCDDSSFMNMTVISTQDWGHKHSWFNNESDTIAIVFHQLLPQVSCEIDDLGDANAALIAAAPELLAALEELEELAAPNIYPQPDKPNSAWAKLKRARAAIAKAKGHAE